MSLLETAVATGFVALTLWTLPPLAATARADGVFHTLITPADNNKLTQLNAVREQALAEARAGGTTEDLAILDQTLAGDLLSVREGFNAVGDWSCRTLKLGKGAPLVVYGWFDCRITDDGAGWFLDKRGGSQRTSGRFYDNGDKEMYYLGVLSVTGDPAVTYGAAPARDQVARVVRPGPNRLRLEFPLPAFESRFDILELERKR